MRVPASTYRLQIRSSFTLFDAAARVPYLKSLGADWVYLSPILTAEQGSDHGYDVTDPSSVDPSRGGPRSPPRGRGSPSQLGPPPTVHDQRFTTAPPATPAPPPDGVASDPSGIV